MYGLSFDGSFEAWRSLARSALAARVEPLDISWYPPSRTRGRELFADSWASALPEATAAIRPVPKAFVEGARVVAYHRSEAKWDFLYRLLWRLVHEDARLLEIKSDSDVREFFRMQQAITRDAHKMKAFVRFRKLACSEQEAYVAWHQPDHPLLRYVAPFFQDRFRVLRWTIFTPDESVAWDGETLHWGPGCEQSEIETDDQLEELWSCYYASIFNPARVKVKAMKAEMAVRHWKTLPETALIPELLHTAPERVAQMLALTPKSAASLVPDDDSQWEDALNRCDICSFACDRPPVLAMGPSRAPWVLLVPAPHGDRLLSDAADRWLREQFARLGLPWDKLIVTAAVKHAKQKRVEPRDIAACKPWLAAELRRIRPEILFCSGLSAGLAIMGRLLRWSEVEGQDFTTRAASRTLISYDLERMLQLPDGNERQRQEQRWRDDLARAFVPLLSQRDQFQQSLTQQGVEH